MNYLVTSKTNADKEAGGSQLASGTFTPEAQFMRDFRCGTSYSAVADGGAKIIFELEYLLFLFWMSGVTCAVSKACLLARLAYQHLPPE
jgi:hypothetical protein